MLSTNQKSLLIEWDTRDMLAVDAAKRLARQGDYAAAVSRAKLAAEQGDSVACYLLASWYFEGIEKVSLANHYHKRKNDFFIPKDYVKSLHFYALAAAKGNPDARNILRDEYVSNKHSIGPLVFNSNNPNLIASIYYAALILKEESMIRDLTLLVTHYPHKFLDLVKKNPQDWISIKPLLEKNLQNKIQKKIDKEKLKRTPKSISKNHCFFKPEKPSYFSIFLTMLRSWGGMTMGLLSPFIFLQQNNHDSPTECKAHRRKP